ncbi:uncharacterized protein LOC130929087 isoform X3 [Corythoichthys intestinalis]|uniref:uncharacterized protein LOC130929087 isoform X3 n=1 Tax=Corythoichthys intestinalis TaxID=161448 RepID=UPI0025A54360|nr:uncharacterized protein LOC130929087 isoform X3 [Corythoichthys intestinalis]
MDRKSYVQVLADHTTQDVSQAHRPERQESPRMEEESPYIKKVEEEFVHIKEEQEEYFIRVENPHIEEQQQHHPLRKEEEDPPYVKVEVVDILKSTDEPLKSEDASVREASRGSKPQNGSNSSSKEGSQADNLIARPSESDNFTSNSLFSCLSEDRRRDLKFYRIPRDPERRARLTAAIRRENWAPNDYHRLCSSHFISDVSEAHRPERQESPRMEEESPYIKVEEEFVHVKEEQEEYFIRLQNLHIEEQQQSDPLKKEEEDLPYVKVEVVDIPKWTVEPLKGESGGPGEASRAAEPPNGSSTSKEGSQADNLIARPSESDEFTSHSLFCEYHVIHLEGNV